MGRTSIALVVAVVLIIAGSLIVVAQSNQLNLLQPAVVNITQAVPVNVTLGGIVGGQQVTLTAPMTVNIALQLRLEGRGAVVAAASQAAPAAAASSGAVYNDGRGIPYKAEVPSPFVLTQLTSRINSLDMTEIVGEIKNAGSEKAQKPEVIVTFYKDGKIVSVDRGYVLIDELAPGQSSPFQLMATSVGPGQMNAYTIQLQKR